MTSLPIYDATAPIACTISADEVPERLGVLERLRADLTEVTPAADGFLLHFPPRDDIEADLHRFSVDEKRCCRFWGFAVEASDERLTLRWAAPPEARDLLADIVGQLQGSEPLTDLAGLL